MKQVLSDNSYLGFDAAAAVKVSADIDMYLLILLGWLSGVGYSYSGQRINAINSISNISVRNFDMEEQLIFKQIESLSYISISTTVKLLIFISQVSILSTEHRYHPHVPWVI